MLSMKWKEDKANYLVGVWQEARERGRLRRAGNRLISYRQDPANLLGLANIKENKWRDLYWYMENSPAHGFGRH